MPALLPLLSALAGLLLAPAWAQDLTPTPVPSPDGVAQSDDGDALDDILGEESSTKDEVDAVKSGDLDDSIGAKKEDIVLPEDQVKKKRLIKVLQKKDFLKLGRVEIGPHASFVANDPFLNRYIGGVSAGYHLTEVFEIEADIGYSPDLADADWKPLTKQLVNENRVSPDISKLILYGDITFGFSPIYGKVAVGRKIIHFDIFGNFGMGMARTIDDLEALQAEPDDQRAIATQVQTHPTTNLGGGLRIVFNPNFALRVEGRSLIYIETVQSTTLEMKNNLILQTSATFFVPRLKS